MNILGHVTVLPQLPSNLKALDSLAKNLYWTWSPEARALFRDLDPELWEAVHHSPVTLLRDISQNRLDAAAKDKAFVKRVKRVANGLDAYCQAPGWYGQTHGKTQKGKKHLYAYFCAEYGWHEAVALYSGGLGILAGDHTKAASDLGVPLVGVGLWYPEGYFHQQVEANGTQKAVYRRKDPSQMPFSPAMKGGEEVRVSVTLQNREVKLRALEVKVGRVSVYLLDTNIPENTPEDRDLLKRLYGGDQRTRISQEIILGIGGVRLLRALDLAPTTWHMNEGHSAFMALERCCELIEQGLDFATAREAVTADTVFTVHTPVVAGNDAFPFDLISQFFSHFWPKLQLSQQGFMDLARHDLGWGPMFSMPALALRFSSYRNGVARLHGDTSRRIWNDLWPEVPTDEVPISHITNGVHYQTWVAPQIQNLTSKMLPKDWQDKAADPELWQSVKKLDNSNFWEVRKEVKAQSVRFLRRRVVSQLKRNGATPTQLAEAEKLLDPNTLTIGFARRFATYKRATLIFRDVERLSAILNNPARPLQLVFSGKAHPADEPGQALIRQIQTASQDPRFYGKILFVEDYDMAVGRALTRGVDVWLNNPRRPLEASGTSGQKASMNGLLNLSILDGWWPEGYDGQNGWAIGGGQREAGLSDHGNAELAERVDAADADDLYNLLEREVAPLYYERDANDVPQAWLERSKDAVASITPNFSASRMVQDYVNNAYAPASERGQTIQKKHYAAASELSHWRKQVSAHWPEVYLSAKPTSESVHQVGDTVTLEAILHPRKLDGTPIQVEVVYGPQDQELRHDLHVAEMSLSETYPDGSHKYTVSFKPEVSGQLAYGVRAYPVNEHLSNQFDAHAIRWA